MSAPKPTQLGSVTVAVESDSLYFGYNTPIEIRDASMQLVPREKTARSFSLPEGMYQVSAVLEDGQEHTRLVRVHADSNTPVQFGVRGGAASENESKRASDAILAQFVGKGLGTQSFELGVAEGSLTQLRNSRFMGKADSPDDESALVARIPSKLLATEGVNLVRQGSGLWIFESIREFSSVANATVQIGDRRTQISLPTHPSIDGRTLCAVRIDESARGAHATAWISPERIVANALQNMLASGNLSAAASMADQATMLLRDKYADPTGAALGAIILHKVGQLSRYEGWMENLARDFAWIPDGKILLATLLVERRVDLDRARLLALEAAKQRILYAESYSLLLDLLRRWPRDTACQEILAAIGDLARWSPYVDWNSSCFSLYLED